MFEDKAVTSNISKYFCYMDNRIKSVINVYSLVSNNFTVFQP